MGPQQQQAFENIKSELTSHTVLTPFNVNFETQISADASSFCPGALICQKQPSGEWHPVAYQSRAMTLKTEQGYSQIEKEGLAVTWACERFNHYFIGLPFSIVTDHKPLVPLLCTKSLDNLPPRIRRFRLKLMRYDFTIRHIPGKELVTADTLSRASTNTATRRDHEFQSEVAACLAAVTDALSVTDKRLKEFLSLQEEDHVGSSWPRTTPL